MGFVRAKIKIWNPQKIDRKVEVQLIADTGAMYTVISRKTLEELGLEPTGRRRFKLADGRTIERDVTIAGIEAKERIAHSNVIFGDKGDEPVLGVTALEELGLEVDPITGELKPMELLLL